MPGKTKISVYDYDNFRTFLKDFYASSKSQNKNFSYRFFARLLGYSSPIFFKRVMDGTRNLTDDGIARFSRALKLGKEERGFFKNLVLMNQAVNEEERRGYAQELLATKALRRLHPLKEAQFSYYANWYLVPVREMVRLPTFREDPKWIAKAMVPEISAAQARDALVELERLGLLERDQKRRLRQTTHDITSPDEIISVFKADWLLELIRLGGESIRKVEREKRDISSVTIGVSPKAIESIKELAQKFRREVMKIASQESEAVEEIYQLNIQLFPLTQVETTKANKT